MKTKFGVNSAVPINKKLKNGYLMYDWIKRQKCFPSFCMRTLCGEEKITVEEIDFLKEKDCKIGLVIRDFTELKVSNADGIKDAQIAAEEAKKLGVPHNAGIAIFAEIKPEWSISHDWMLSFASVLSTNGYIPGFIGNTDSSKNFNFDRQCGHFVQATKNINYFEAVFMATEPKYNRVPEEWAPYCPSVLEVEDIALWACGKTTFDQIEVDDVYARDLKVLEAMW